MSLCVLSLTIDGAVHVCIYVQEIYQQIDFGLCVLELTRMGACRAFFGGVCRGGRKHRRARCLARVGGGGGGGGGGGEASFAGVAALHPTAGIQRKEGMTQTVNEKGECRGGGGGGGGGGRRSGFIYDGARHPICIGLWVLNSQSGQCGLLRCAKISTAEGDRVRKVKPLFCSKASLLWVARVCGR